MSVNLAINLTHRPSFKGRTKVSRGKLKKEEKKKVSKGLEVNPEEARMIRIIEELSQFEEWSKEVPEVLKEAILSGKTAPELYDQFDNVAAVRVLQILMTETNSGQALAAAKDLLDRKYGRATEKKIIKHEFEEMSDEQLIAISKSETGELGDD